MDSFLSGFSHSHAAGNHQVGQQYVNNNSSGSQAVQGRGNVSEVDASQLQKGDTFQGEIASVNGEEVHIKLTTGQYMTARLERDVQVAIGQILNFQVQSNKDNKVVLKPVNINNMQFQRVGQAALRAANLAMTEKNLSMVSKMIENGMPIDKNSLMSINKFSLQHPQADVSDIIRMVKLKIPVTENNLIQFKNYQNMEHKLLDGVKEVSEDVFKTFQNISQGNNSVATASANKFMEQVIKIFSEADMSKQQITGSLTESEAGNVNTQAGHPQTASETIENHVNIQGQDASQRSSIINDGKAIQLIEQEISKLSEKINNSKTDAPIVLNETNEKVLQGFSNKFIEIMKDSSLDIKDINYLFSNNSIIKNLPEQIKSQIFDSEPFRELVRKNIRNLWTISPEELTKEGKLQEFYEKLSKQSRELSEAANNAMQASANNVASNMKSVNNIRENVEFMNQMNSMFNYIQLPLKLSNSQAHGDLYVYTNKRNLARKDGMLTAFLHLDMDNLGGIDINIELQTQRNQVTTKFYVEENMMDFMQEHMDELNQRLVRKGYQCKNYIDRIDSEKTVLQHIEEQAAIGNVMLKYQTFDTRA